jgi:methyl-accepting chemotaxis protein
MKIRRRNYFINKTFQFGHMANMLLIQLLGVAVSGGVMAWIGLFVLNRRLVGDLDAAFIIRIGIILAFLVGGVIFWAVKSSHAIAGPIYKCGRIMREAAAGELPPGKVYFRKRDEFKGLAEDLNRLLDAVRADRHTLDEMRREIRALSDSLAAGALTAAECREALEYITKEIAESRESVHEEGWLSTNPT